MYSCREDSKNRLFSLPGLFYSSFKFQIKPPFLSDACPGTLDQVALSTVCLYCILRGSFFYPLARLQLCV